MIGFDEVANHLGLGEAHSLMKETWPLTQARFGENERPFLDPVVTAESCHFLEMPEAFTREAVAAIPIVREDDLLVRYLWHCTLLLADARLKWPPGGGFPHIRPDSTPGAGMGYALVFLNRLPDAAKLYAERGIDKSVMRDTFRDFQLWTEFYRLKTGKWGLANLGWLQGHLRLQLFALGRLQFKLEHYGYDFHGWRQRSTGCVVLLAGEGMVLHPQGYFANADRCAEPPPGSWTAFYEEDEKAVRGMPVDPRGTVLKNPVRLSRADWVKVLDKGDPTVGIHIPAGGPMDFAACGESFSRVAPFFARYAPDHAFKALTCGSWLLDPQFEGRLPDCSNTVRFLREMYLTPMPGASDYAFFERIFNGVRPAPGASEEGMTTMQKAIWRFSRSGGTWRTTACVLFPEDLAWGRQAYRLMWPEGAIAGELSEGGGQ